MTATWARLRARWGSAGDALLLLLPTIVVYLPGLAYPFVGLDDVHYVVRNPAIRDLSWDGLRFLFLEDRRDFRYVPLSYVSLALDYRLFGLDPFFFHLTSLLFHLANTLLVARLVERVFGDAALAFGTALLFSLHPLQVESVEWVMSRKNVLFLFFFLIAALVYLDARDRRREGRPGAGGRLAFSSFLYLVACLSKNAALPLPAVLVLMDLVSDPPAHRHPIAFLRRSLPSKLPYVPPAVAVMAIMSRYSAPNPFRTDFGFGSLEWLQIVSYNFFFYVEKAVLPIGLSPFYPLPEAGSFPPSFEIRAALGLALFGVALLAFVRGWTATFFGVAWYLVTIAPNTLYAFVFSDLPILAADRYFYQSAIGLLLLPPAAGLALWRKRARWRPALAPLAAAAVLALSFQASRHRAAWRSDIAIYESVVDDHPNDDFYYRLALARAAAGQLEGAFRALDEARGTRRKIFFMDFLYYRLQLAALHLEQGDLAAAADQVEGGIEATPNAFEPFDARTPLAYLFLADVRERAGQADAAASAEEAARGARSDPEHRFELEWLRTMRAESRRFLEARVARDPNDGAAWFVLGIAAELDGDERAAEQRFALARSLGYRPAPASDARGR